MIVTKKPVSDQPRSKVIVMTAVADFASSYSLNSVILDQLRALVLSGYQTQLWVHETCNMALFPTDLDGKVEVKKLIPSFHWQEDVVNEDGVTAIKKVFSENLLNEPLTIITHDLMFISWFVTFAKAIHSLQPNSNHRWFHIAHSAAGANQFKEYPQSLRTSLPHGNHKIICLSRSAMDKFANYYGVSRDRITTVYNSRDVRRLFRFPEKIYDFVFEHDLTDAEIVQVYPFSTTRSTSKGVHHVVQVFGELKKMGFRVRLVLLNCHASGKDADANMLLLRAVVKECDLEQEVIFFSDKFPTLAYVGADEPTVGALLQLSNLFIFPTVSEAGPLVLMEAALAGCLLVLNSLVPSLADYVPPKYALQYKFDGTVSYRQIAMDIASNLSRSASNMSKRHVLRNNSVKAMAKQLSSLIGR